MLYINSLFSSDSLKVLCVVIVMDLCFGILRGIKEKEINSCIGIDGMIRKVGMLITILFLTVIDSIVEINFIGFIPEEIRTFLEVDRVGINFLFSLLFIIFEILSIFKNMVLCKLPIPKKLQIFFENALKEFTGEIKEGDK